MGSRLPLIIYAPLMLLLWAAVRFGPLGTSASVLLVAALAIWGVRHGHGPFATESAATDLAHLQLFLFTRSVPLLLLSAMIQQQRRTAHALRASQEQHRAVVEDHTEPICRFQPDGTLTFVNGAWARALGQAVEDLVGRSFWSLMPPGAQAAHAEALSQLRPERPMATWEQERETAGGEHRWEQWRVRALFDEKGRIVDFQALGLDSTERKRAEQERQQLQAQQAAAEALREADRRKDEFLAMLAHELRNPLAPISMVAEVLRELPDADETVRWGREVIARQVDAPDPAGGRSAGRLAHHQRHHPPADGHGGPGPGHHGRAGEQPAADCQPGADAHRTRCRRGRCWCGATACAWPRWRPTC